MSDFAGRAFVIALALTATVVITYFGLGVEYDQPPPGGRWKRFTERMKELSEAYSGRKGRGDPWR